MRARTLVFAVLALLACSAGAAPLVTTGGVLDVGRIELTGTALARSAFGEQVTVHAQSRATGLFAPSGAAYENVGLGRSFEITALIGFGETQGIGPAGELVFALDPANPVNYFRLFLDTSPNANALEGTGFADGTLIAAGRVVALQGEFSFADTVEPLDQHGANDYPGLLSLVAGGVDTVVIAVEAVDAAVFPAGLPALLTGIAPSGFPFTFIDPSRRYETLTGALVPDIGAVNGFSGPDLVLQTRFTVSFVPEPASTLPLVGFGLLATGAARRRSCALHRQESTAGRLNLPAPPPASGRSPGAARALRG